MAEETRQWTPAEAHLVKGGKAYYTDEYLGDTYSIESDGKANEFMFDLSPSGTAFAIGSATYFGDTDFRSSLLTTAEIVGSTIRGCEPITKSILTSTDSPWGRRRREPRST